MESSTVNDKMDPPLVMISYQWDAQRRMLKLKDELIRAGYEVWMDVDKMEGNLDDRMSEAVEKASVILACFSEKYQASASCKKEAQYSDYLKKPIIPLKYEEYQPSGWLGLLINPLLYYEVQTDEAMMRELPKILKAVQQHASGQSSGLGQDLPTGSASHASSLRTSTILEACQKELQTFYQQEMGTVQLLPWGDDVIDMDTIFVNLTLAVDEKQLPRGSGQQIERIEDMLELGGSKGQRASRVLLRGFAGSGKSTALAKIAYDWSKSLESTVGINKVLSQFKLLFILSLREIESNETLSDAIMDQILPQDTELSRQDLEEFIRAHSKETLILLDGLDEYPMEQLQKKVTGDIESVLANKKLRDACVVVSTRPEKVEDLGEYQKHYIHVKLSGFSEENIEVYIRKFFQDNQTMAAGLIKVLRENPSIKILAQIPVMLLMLCLLWSDSRKLPDTHTSLYEQAVLYLWKRYRKTGDVSEKNDDFRDVLQHLGRVALDGLTSEDCKLVFSESDFPEHVLVEACKAGLLTKERLRSKLNVCNSVSFLHKSVQEYCAAHYWSTLVETDVDLFHSYLNRISDDAGVFVHVELLTFCCGMSEQAAALVIPHVVQLFKHRTCESLHIGGLTHLVKAEKDIWPLFRMLRESGLKYEAVHSWFEPLFEMKVVEIRQNPPSSLMYFHHLVQIIAKSKVPSVLSEVRALKVFCGSGALGLIVDALNRMTQVESLVLSWETEVVDNRPSESQVMELTESVGKLSKLKEITVLARRKLEISRLIRSLYRGPKCSRSVRKIELGNVDFDPEIMGNALEKQTCLEALILTNISLSPIGAAQMLSHISSSLQTFEAISTPIGDAIQHLKPLMPSLQDVVVRDAELEESDVNALADFLPKGGRLRNLDLSWNNGVGPCMVKIARQLQHCPMLLKLGLVYCNMTQRGMIALIDSFRYLKRLQVIKMGLRQTGQLPKSNPANGFEIAEALFQSLHYLPELRIIDVQCLSVPEGDSGSELLSVCLEAMDIDLAKLVRLRSVQSSVKFSIGCRPIYGDRLLRMKEAVARFEGTAV